MKPTKKVRQLVSLQKKRFQEGDFDLDLAYITDNIIAFGFPAEGRESVFRNPMDECQRFFETFHPGKYFVYNLCIEKDRQYKAKKFHDRVAKFQWADHMAPPLEMVPEFCKHAADWLEKDNENVVAIHCKAGKGRTGVLICCLLLYLKMFETADEAMEYYGQKRTHNGKGVTIPSQKRFVRYYHRTMVEGIPPKHETAFLKKVVVNKISNLDDIHFSICIESNGTTVVSKKKGDKGLIYLMGDDSVALDLGTVPVSGNTKVTLFRHKKKEELLHFWFHCHYMGEIFRMEKHEIDKVAHDKTHKIFDPEFSVEVHFEATGLYDAQAFSEKKNESEPEGENSASTGDSCE